MCSIAQFIKKYPTDEACLEGIMELRYGGTFLECPKCKRGGQFYRESRDRAYICQHCKFHLFPCVGTPMERSRTSLQKWFLAFYLFTTSRHGIAAKELQRQLGVTYKCAWRMAHKIREFMAQIDREWSLDGGVEADETYVGGRRSGGKRGRGAPGKTVVFGMLERGGDVMAKVVPDVKKRTLQPIIAENVEPCSIVFTDELLSYKGLEEAGFQHRTVNHGEGEYVNADSHVNSIEGFWSRLKVSIRGTHIHVSGKHLWKYVKEFEYRYNRRKQPGRIYQELFASL